MNLLIILFLIVLVFGGGGGYYGYHTWGYGPGGGIFGVVLVIAIVVYLLRNREI